MSLTWTIMKWLTSMAIPGVDRRGAKGGLLVEVVAFRGGGGLIPEVEILI